jgi:KDO2-lipid IV(A) lauroyltransferase
MWYYLIYSFNRLVALLPLPVLYFFSDWLLFPLVYGVGRYRRDVVRRNLTASFPDKTDAEITQIERRFYHHFCDYAVETVKQFHFSKKEMQQHLQVTGLDIVHRLHDEGRSCLMLLGHYGNWEWVSSLGPYLGDHFIKGQVYRPLKNKAFDRLFLSLRSRFGVTNIAKKDLLRVVMECKRDGQQFFVGTIADQRPPRANIHYYTTFMNQDTPVLTGTERIAQKTDAAVVYLDMKKVKRGYYECRFKMLTEFPKETGEFEITEKYMREMEQTILRDPALYLWTHKRWKYTRPQTEIDADNRSHTT